MITGLDHVVLLTADLEAGRAAYARLLGRVADWQSEDGAEQETALFRLGNTALELVAPAAQSAADHPVRQTLSKEGGGLKSLVFASDDLSADSQLLTRRGLEPGPIQPGSGVDLATGRVRRWHRFRTPARMTAGVRLFFLEHEAAGPPEAAEVPLDCVHALDHLVINTPNPDRALALYGAKLGLRLALDRNAPEWGVRLIFFRIGGLTLEIAHRLGEAVDPAGPDEVWGLSWRVGDINAAHERLSRLGLALSSVRDGRRPGTRVFTVRDGTLGVPTLFISGPAD